MSSRPEYECDQCGKKTTGLGLPDGWISINITNEASYGERMESLWSVDMDLCVPCANGFISRLPSGVIEKITQAERVL